MHQCRGCGPERACHGAVDCGPGIVGPHELLPFVFNGVIVTGGEKEWGQSRAVPINPEHS
ncbi:hypothetical protein J6590_006340 [Homalodisca vitripennis]|nr:hypothetical protein J6590_006340 [Homalodisca vitripennis]